jgi:aerobic carbon-monoxide dehydrogenase medium subunit
VKPAQFTYHRPRTLAEAVRLLAELAPQDGRVLAGGQSLVPIMAFRLARPAHLIDINAVTGLDVLAAHDGVLRIGARARHAAFHRPVQDGPLGAMLAAVVRHIASARLLPGRHGNGACTRRVARRDSAGDPTGRYTLRFRRVQSPRR